MWNADEPEVWKEHDWVPYGAIEKAASMYAGDSIDPMQAYDIEIARALVKEGR